MMSFCARAAATAGERTGPDELLSGNGRTRSVTVQVSVRGSQPRDNKEKARSFTTVVDALALWLLQGWIDTPRSKPEAVAGPLSASPPALSVSPLLSQMEDRR